MFVENKEDLYYDESKYLDEISFFDDADDREFSIEEEEACDNIFNFLQDIIDQKDKQLDEMFFTEPCSRDHFRSHCLGNRNLRSTRSSVYYDFKTWEDYIEHENLISKKTLANSAMHIRDFLDINLIMKHFRKLFEGDNCLVFDLGCGFHNNVGGVRLCINAYATDSTLNYSQNTVDFLVQTPGNKTLSLYPIDANYLESKLNNEISKIPNSAKLAINH